MTSIHETSGALPVISVRATTLTTEPSAIAFTLQSDNVAEGFTHVFNTVLPHYMHAVAIRVPKSPQSRSSFFLLNQLKGRHTQTLWIGPLAKVAVDNAETVCS